MDDLFKSLGEHIGIQCGLTGMAFEPDGDAMMGDPEDAGFGRLEQDEQEPQFRGLYFLQVLSTRPSGRKFSNVDRSLKRSWDVVAATLHSTYKFSGAER